MTNYIDTARLLKEFKGDEEILVELCAAFLLEIPSSVAAIAAAVTSKDAKALEFTAHTLKGAAANFQAPLIKDVCYELEKQGRNNDLTASETNFATLKPMMEGLTIEINALASQLKKGAQ